MFEDIMGRTKKYCVVIPIYKETLLPEEHLALEQLTKIVKSADIYIMCPKGINLKVYERHMKAGDMKIMEFTPKYFSSTQEYSRLLESPMFYKKFVKYEYMLIYQTDCWIFEDKLEYFANKGYDYYGSPWIVDNKGHIGNGGFSFRKIAKFIDFTTEHKGEFYPIEDRYFCEMYQDEFNMCDYETGCEFGVCSMADYEQLAALNAGRMKCPMGMHRMLDERLAPYFFNVVDNKTGNKFPKEYVEKYMTTNNKHAEIKKNMASTQNAMLSILNMLK